MLCSRSPKGINIVVKNTQQSEQLPLKEEVLLGNWVVKAPLTYFCMYIRESLSELCLGHVHLHHLAPEPLQLPHQTCHIPQQLLPAQLVSVAPSVGFLLALSNLKDRTDLSF